ncbi:uncharacterized protein V6R79_007293 [Siganus canaliculatus]
MFKFYLLSLCVLRVCGELLYVNPGDNVTLQCFYSSADANHLCWYKQLAGEQPKIISSFYTQFNTFYNQFKGDRRFAIEAGKGFYHLNISNIQDSDSAAYYCGHTSIAITEFYSGKFLFLRDSRRRPFLLQPPSDTVKQGGSVTLNCTVQSGTSDGEHKVYWFKKDSGNQHLGILYVHTHNSAGCVMSLRSEAPAHNCVSSLSKKNVSPSDAGTYYCAVASCGEILFGKGTALKVEGKVDDISPVLMHCMVAALLVSVIFNIILLSVIWNISRRKHHSAVQATSVTASSSAHPEGAFLSLQTGENATLKCFYKADVSARLYWYKHMLGQKTNPVSAFNAHDSFGTFYDEFETDGRFTLDTESGSYDLKISNIQLSDSGLYYCSSTSVRQENRFISANVGASVTLRCFILEHTAVVFWYKQSLGQKPTPISSFYRNGEMEILMDELEYKSHFSLDSNATKNHLKISDLRISDSATYYCVSCYGATSKNVQIKKVCERYCFLHKPHPTVQHHSANQTPSGLYKRRDTIAVLFISRSSLNTMASPVFALYITCLFLGKTAQTKNLELSRSDQPEHRFVSVKTGETLCLHCSYEGDIADWFYWYKQSLGQKPRLIADYYRTEKKAQTKNLELSRSDQPEHRFVTVKTGETLMLHCSYEGDIVDWFYWYKQSLGQKPRLIADYYRRETKANFYHELKGEDKLGTLQFLVYVLSGVSAFSSLLVVVLSFTICIMNKRTSCQSSGNWNHLLLTVCFH